MSDAEIVRTVFEGLVALGVLGSLVVALLKLGGIGKEIETHGVQISKIETTLETMAEQRAELRSIQRTLNDLIARTDATFGRVFQSLDRINERWQGKRTDSSP